MFSRAMVIRVMIKKRLRFNRVLSSYQFSPCIMKETEKVKEEERSSIILITDVLKWTAYIRATVFHLQRKGVRAHRQGHCIALTLILTLPNAIYYFFHLLANLKCCTHITGDNIAVKRCSVPRVERILHDFGIEIGEGETLRDRKETKMVSVDGTESKKIVVRGM